MNKKWILVFIIIYLCLFWIVLIWISFKNKDTQNTFSGNTFSWSIKYNTQDKKISIKIIEDKRNTETNLDGFLENLIKQIPELENSEIKKLDFSDDSVRIYMEKNYIKTLPAVIFSTDNFDEIFLENQKISIKNYLTKMENWEFYLKIWATYNPFTASARWIPILNKNTLEAIKTDSFFVDWNDKKIIWLELWDLSCPFCQAFHESGIIEEILKDYSSEISKTYNHLIVHPGKHFETLECLVEQWWKEWFFKFIDIFYKDWVYKEDDLEIRLVKDLYDMEKIKTCVSEWKFVNKIENQSKRAVNEFWVRSTPTSVFINTETWEYKIISGYTENFWKEPYIKAIESIK